MNLAVLAFFQGAFNSCSFEWQLDGRCKITLVDNLNNATGSFMATYNDDKSQIIDISDETGMNDIAAMPIPKPIFIKPVIPLPTPDVQTFDPDGNLIEPASLPAPKKKKGGQNA